MAIPGLASGNSAAPAQLAAAAVSPIGPISPAATLAAVETKMLTGFLIAMSLLLFGGGYTYYTSVEFTNSIEWVAHTQEVRATVASLYGSLSGAELAQRDYLLTAKPGRLDEHLRLMKIVKERLADLGRLTADNPAQSRNLSELQSAVNARSSRMAAALLAYRTYGLAAARAVLAVGQQQPGSSDAIRAITERMDALEVKLLTQRQRDAVSVRRNTVISLLTTLAAAAMLFIGLFRGVQREMHARREAEDALRASEQYSRSIVDSSPDALTLLTPEARILQMTSQASRLMDLDERTTAVSADWLDFWSGEHRESARAAVQAATGGAPGRFQASALTRAGAPNWWDVIVIAIPGADGKPQRLLAVARDITEVKNAETQLRAANRFLDSLVDSLPVMIFLKDARTFRYVRQNRATLNLLGLSSEDVLGKRDSDFLPAEQAAFILSKDREVLASGRLVDIPEQSINTRLGVRTLHTTKMPILDEQGAPQFLLGISEDITERKLAEQAIHELNTVLMEKAAQLEASNQELESFSYSVSHDLRAPLRAIDGFALMMEEDYHAKLDAEGMRYLSVIRENSRRMGALIDDLLAFSRLGRQTVTVGEVNVEALVHEVIGEVLQGKSRENRGATALPQIEVGPLPPAQADRSLLRQVWINLIGNAVKYSAKAVQPRIEISGAEVGEERQYSVRDNGVGFNMEYADKLFRVFQRLHRTDEFAGTGVGLAIVHRVVTRHGGRVWAEGKVDHGAVFSFALPAGAQRE